MSWILDSSYSWFQRLCINIVKAGPVPKHVAFIMDGNRRFAKKLNVEKVEGHTKGFDKLAETLQWCSDLGIPEVTVYAFSIENFKRSKEEVDTLMKLAKDKFRQLLNEEREKVMANGVCIRVIGDLSLLDTELRSLVAEVMLMTRDNKKAFLNIALAYTSRHEMTEAVKAVVKGAEEKQLSSEDVDEDLLSGCLYTAGSPNPDLLVRTSGEVRFSDFLLWQCAGAQVHFANVLWPEFRLRHLLAAVFTYQRGLRSKQQLVTTVTSHTPRGDAFIEQLNRQRLEQLRLYATA